MTRRTLVNLTFAGTLLMAGMLAGCGTSTFGPDGGSHANTLTGVGPSGYPGGQPPDAATPALASSTESQYSRDQKGEPKLPEVPADKSKK